MDLFPFQLNYFLHLTSFPYLETARHHRPWVVKKKQDEYYDLHFHYHELRLVKKRSSLSHDCYAMIEDPKFDPKCKKLTLDQLKGFAMRLGTDKSMNYFISLFNTNFKPEEMHERDFCLRVNALDLLTQGATPDFLLCNEGGSAAFRAVRKSGLYSMTFTQAPEQCSPFPLKCPEVGEDGEPFKVEEEVARLMALEDKKQKKKAAYSLAMMIELKQAYLLFRRYVFNDADLKFKI